MQFEKTQLYAKNQSIHKAVHYYWNYTNYMLSRWGRIIILFFFLLWVDTPWECLWSTRTLYLKLLASATRWQCAASKPQVLCAQVGESCAFVTYGKKLGMLLHMSF